MSQPSFHLRKHLNGRFYAVARHGGKEFSTSTRKTDKGEAEKAAADWLAKISKTWGAPAAGPVIPETKAEPAAAPTAPPERRAPLKREHAPERAAEIANKLRGLAAGAAPTGEAGAPASGTPDNPEVLSSLGYEAEKKKAEEEKKKAETEELDMEANELFATMCAGAIVGGHLSMVKKLAANREPPVIPHEPNEMCLEWERAGVAKKMQRLFGKAGGMSENTKLLIGFAGVTLSMLWDAPEVPRASRPRAPAAAQPAPAAAAPGNTSPAAAAAHGNTSAPAAQPRQPLALVPTPHQDKPAAADAAVGKF